MRYCFAWLCLFLCISFQAYNQCGITISSFPYTEGFEASAGGWVSGGTGNDWAWGTPAKGYITSAGGGTKCWVTGGLTGSFYNFGQRSYVVSPCFDFSGVSNPYVSMKIYVEGENVYDGATFQYSLNNGTSWINVGTNTDPVDCLNENWFNQSNINALLTLATPRHGWAGTIQPSAGSCNGGGGTGGWVTAKHCMSYLAGVSNVQFRFAFGAGTICNAYDGFAFDDIYIGEAPANTANFSYSCLGSPLSYQFSNTSGLCPTSFAWNFGDPASGANNTSTSMNPIHTFSSAGTYTVTLTVSGPCNASSTIAQTIQTVSASASANPATCFGATDGTIYTSATGGAGGYTFAILPGGAINSTGLFSGLGASIYTIVATDASGCSASTITTITAPSALTLSTSHTPIACFGGTTTLTLSSTGGSGGYTYTVLPTGATNSTGIFGGLSSGTYTLTVSDANGCTTSSVSTISQPGAPVSIISFSAQQVLCFNANNGSINILATGGTSPITYTLLPTLTTNSTGVFSGLQPTSYTIVASDANGCSASTSTSIFQPTLLSINSILVTPPGCTPSNDGTVLVNASGGSGALLYSMGGTFTSNPLFTSLTPTSYTITVKDANGCTATSSTTLISNDAPVFLSSTSKSVTCYGYTDGSIQILASSSTPVLTYSLSPGGASSTTGDFINLSSDTYTVTVTDANSCTNTTTIKVNTPQPINFNKIYYANDSCQYQNNGLLTVEAKGGNGTIRYELQPLLLSSNDGKFFNIPPNTYTVVATDVQGCFATTVTEVKEIICCENIFFPNAFSPNDDMRNDEFKPLSTTGIVADVFVIYNRWGQAVFTSKHSEDRWDGTINGTKAEIGTYYYLYKYSCGNPRKEYVIKGDLLLLR